MINSITVSSRPWNIPFMNMKQFRPLRVNKCRSANENHGTFSCYGRDRHGKRGIQVFQCQRVLREKSAAVEIEAVGKREKACSKYQSHHWKKQGGVNFVPPADRFPADHQHAGKRRADRLLRRFSDGQQRESRHGNCIPLFWRIFHRQVGAKKTTVILVPGSV